jgi:hypothetical protein
MKVNVLLIKKKKRKKKKERRRRVSPSNESYKHSPLETSKIRKMTKEKKTKKKLIIYH